MRATSVATAPLPDARNELRLCAPNRRHPKEAKELEDVEALLEVRHEAEEDEISLLNHTHTTKNKQKKNFKI